MSPSPQRSRRSWLDSATTKRKWRPHDLGWVVTKRPTAWKCEECLLEAHQAWCQSHPSWTSTPWPSRRLKTILRSRRRSGEGSKTPFLATRLRTSNCLENSLRRYWNWSLKLIMEHLACDNCKNWSACIRRQSSFIMERRTINSCTTRRRFKTLSLNQKYWRSYQARWTTLDKSK